MLKDFSYWVGWDDEIRLPVLISSCDGRDPHEDLYRTCLFEPARSFEWYNDRYGPMQRLELI